MMKHAAKLVPLIRSERATESSAISALVIKAYAAVPYSDHREHLMVEALRASPSFVPELSLVGEIGDDLAGYLLLTKITVEGASGPGHGLSLAPLAIAPEYQDRGVGAALVSEAHTRAERLGFEYVLLIGLPHYYPRFGYEPLGNHPIGLPFLAPQANCMIRRLRPDGLKGVEGVVRFDPAWLDH
jgi:predicted N-acetyltransferase YhbS